MLPSYELLRKLSIWPSRHNSSNTFLRSASEREFCKVFGQHSDPAVFSFSLFTITACCGGSCEDTRKDSTQVAFSTVGLRAAKLKRSFAAFSELRSCGLSRLIRAFSPPHFRRQIGWPCSWK